MQVVFKGVPVTWLGGAAWGGLRRSHSTGYAWRPADPSKVQRRDDAVCGGCPRYADPTPVRGRRWRKRWSLPASGDHKFRRWCAGIRKVHHLPMGTAVYEGRSQRGSAVLNRTPLHLKAELRLKTGWVSTHRRHWLLKPGVMVKSVFKDIYKWHLSGDNQPRHRVRLR